MAAHSPIVISSQSESEDSSDDLACTFVKSEGSSDDLACTSVKRAKRGPGHFVISSSSDSSDKDSPLKTTIERLVSIRSVAGLNHPFYQCTSSSDSELSDAPTSAIKKIHSSPIK